MFDMSWGEVMVIGGVALIVIGPKDLPKALRTVGQMTAKVRRLAAEFQTQFNDAMREAELEDVRKEVEGLNQQVASATSTAFNPIQTIRDELKGAVEVKSPTTLPPNTPVADAAVVEDVGPDHHMVPASASSSVASAQDPEPAIPLPPDLVGPGLEPVSEPTAMKSAQA